MPDICACVNTSCAKQNSCYRFRCVWSERQSFALFAPDSDGACHYHWEIEPRVRTLSLEEGIARATSMRENPEPAI
jgi:hypothetical protein